MAKCTNCGATITCGCQKRTAKDGKSCCSSCVAAYDAKLKRTAPTQNIPVNTPPRNKFSF